jgi:quercetin dioxygenase-like cupin family protein
MALPLLASAVPHCIAADNASAFPIKTETLVTSTSCWDGRPYTAYPHGQRQLAVLKITIAPHTTMEWHTDPIPSADYILSAGLYPFRTGPSGRGEEQLG